MHSNSMIGLGPPGTSVPTDYNEIYASALTLSLLTPLIRNGVFNEKRIFARRSDPV